MHFRSTARRPKAVLAALAVLATLALPVASGTLTHTSAATVIEGPDVSHYQHPNGAAINWTKVANAGKAFEISKATEGSDIVDPYFTSDYAASYAAGLVHGAYHFARPALPIASTAVAQAKDFWAEIDGPVTTERTLPPALDLEVTGGLSPSQLVTWAQDFLLEMRTLSGRTPMLYTYPSFWENDLDDPSAFDRYPLWMAEYGVSTAPISDLWQYTDDAKIKGITGAVDESKFTGNRDTTFPWATLSDGTVATPWQTAAPTAPVAVQASGAGGAVTVSWLPPDTGTSPVTGYAVTASPGGKVVSVGGTTYDATFSGLSTTTAYTFTVTATNAVGTGPASEPTVPVTPTIPTVLAASVAKALKYGAALPLTTTLSRSDTKAPLAGQQVLIYRRDAAGDFVQARNLTTNAQGTATATLKPKRSAELEAVFPGTTGVARASIFKSFLVRPTVTASLGKATVAHNHSVILKGSTTPFVAGDTVKREDYYSGAWHVLATKKLGKHGTFSFAVTPTAKGTATYRIVVSATHGRAAGISSSMKLTVT